MISLVCNKIEFFNSFYLIISNLNFIDSPDDLKFLVKEYVDVFSSALGTFTKGIFSNKLKSESLRVRPLPVAIKEGKVEMNLERLLDLGILELFLI